MPQKIDNNITLYQYYIENTIWISLSIDIKETTYRLKSY